MKTETSIKGTLPTKRVFREAVFTLKYWRSEQKMKTQLNLLLNA